MKIRLGGPDDTAAILALLDTAVRWLVDRGITEQWGSEPYSASPARVTHIEEYARDHLVRIAEAEDGAVLGVCVLAEEPPRYVTPLQHRELYVRLLVTERSRSGSGIGAALVDDARATARERGIGVLRVDCFAGASGDLVRQYRNLGFTPAESFTVTRPDRSPWPGQVLALVP